MEMKWEFTSWGKGAEGGPLLPASGLLHLLRGALLPLLFLGLLLIAEFPAQCHLPR